MTSDEVKEGCAVTLRAAHKLRAELGRLPKPTEIQWRTATQFQVRNPMRSGPRLTRIAAMALAQQMMDVVCTAAHYTTDTGEPNGN